MDLVARDTAGERIPEGLLVGTDRRLREEDISIYINLFKNNTEVAADHQRG